MLLCPGVRVYIYRERVYIYIYPIPFWLTGRILCSCQLFWDYWKIWKRLWNLERKVLSISKLDSSFLPRVPFTSRLQFKAKLHTCDMCQARGEPVQVEPFSGANSPHCSCFSLGNWCRMKAEAPPHLHCGPPKQRPRIVRNVSSLVLYVTASFVRVLTLATHKLK